jgi:acyl dehydratase
VQELYFEEYELGAVYETGRRTVTDYDISTFVGLCGFGGPIWMDLDYVRQDKYYAGRLTPGMLVLSLAEGLIIASGIMEDRGLALMELTPRFQKPVLAGDTLFVRTEVTGLHLTSRGDRGVITSQNTIHTINGKEAVSYQAVRMVKAKAFDKN